MSTAMAILKSGRSFDEAAQITGLSVESIMKAWNEANTQRSTT